MFLLSHTFYTDFTGFVSNIILMLLFLVPAIILHELGHILFVKYHGLEYKIELKKGNISIVADWEKLGNKKIYGYIAGIISGLLPVIIGTWLYVSPVFILLYLLACYDDISEVARKLADVGKVL